MRSISPRKIYKRYELSNREDRKCWAIKQVHVYISFVLFYIRVSTVYHLYYFTYVSLLCIICIILHTFLYCVTFVDHELIVLLTVLIL